METSEIFELFDKFDKSSIAEVIISRGDLRVTLRKAVAMGDAHGSILHQHAPVPHANTGGAQPAAAEDGEVIASPIVGTFYRAPSPDSPPFVNVGDTVGPETVVCIVEAMKVFNEIKAECAGTIEKVMVRNGESVEYGQPMFRVRPA